MTEAFEQALQGAVEAVMKAKILRYVGRTARRSLRARWQRSPVTGRLEMHWVVAAAESEPRSSGHRAAVPGGMAATRQAHGRGA